MAAVALPRLKRLLLGLLLALLTLPALKTRLKPGGTSGLGGYEQAAIRPVFSWQGLLDNSYQPALESYVESRVGLRNFFIRLRNQLAYSLFSVAKANQVLVGKDNILFEDGGIQAMLGQDFKGEAEIRRNVRRFKAVQDTLAKRNILLVFAIAPGKAFYYSDQIPAHLAQKPSITNYAVYAREMQAYGVNVLDLGKLFRQWKDTAAYPLFPRGGAHWSGYGITRAADTLFRYLEQRGHFDLPDFQIRNLEVLDGTQDTDNDIAKAMNLLVQPAPYRMAYPRVVFNKPRPGQQQPRLLLVADSFGWGLIGFYPYLPHLFGPDYQYWYYNQAVGPGDPTTPGGPPVERPLDRKAEILRQQVILVLYNQHNLGVFDNGFSASAYSLFFPPAPIDENRIRAIEQQLKQSVRVQDSLWQQANATNRDYSQLLHEAAVRQYEFERL